MNVPPKPSPTDDASNEADKTTPSVHIRTPFHSEERKTRDGSSTLFHPMYEQTYHSHHGAITESKHVFLAHSELAQRLSHAPVRLLEIGIGTGLNLALSATLAQRLHGTLHYLGVEQFPPTREALVSLGYDRYDDIDAALWAQCLDHFEQRTPEWPLPPTDSSTASTIACHWGRFENLDLPAEHFDIVYHDAFSPDVNPECWTTEALQKIVDAMASGATLVTYTVQGNVRRALSACGLEVTRLPGPVDGKKQVLRARKPSLSEHT